MTGRRHFYMEHTGGCPQCGGPVDIVQADMFTLPEPKPGRCVYSKWTRDGVFEDAGVCTKSASTSLLRDGWVRESKP